MDFMAVAVRFMTTSMVVSRASRAAMEISLGSHAMLLMEVKAAANMGMKRMPGLSIRNWVVTWPMVATIISTYRQTTRARATMVALGTFFLGLETWPTRKATATMEPKPVIALGTASIQPQVPLAPWPKKLSKLPVLKLGWVKAMMT